MKELSAQQDEATVVDDGAQLLEHAWLSGRAQLRDHAMMTNSAFASDQAIIQGDAIVADDATVIDWARVSDNAVVKHGARVSGYGAVEGAGRLLGTAHVGDRALVRDVTVHCGAFTHMARVFGPQDYVQLTIGGDIYTGYRCQGNVFEFTVCSMNGVLLWESGTPMNPVFDLPKLWVDVFNRWVEDFQDLSAVG